MAESLKDQLIRAGLAPSGKPKKQRPKAAESDLARAYRLREKQTEQHREQRKQKKLEEEQRRRRINREIKALVTAHAVRDPEAEIARNFMFKGRIRKILVNKDQFAAVNSGELVIVYLSGSYHLVPADKAAPIAKMAPDHLPDLSAESGVEDEEFPVPDDLVW